MSRTVLSWHCTKDDWQVVQRQRKWPTEQNCPVDFVHVLTGVSRGAPWVTCPQLFFVRVSHPGVTPERRKIVGEFTQNSGQKRGRTGKKGCGVTPWVNSALHPSGVAKSRTSFGWGKGGNVTSAGWQAALCDPIWHVSSRSGDGRLACKLLYPSLLYFTLPARG